MSRLTSQLNTRLGYTLCQGSWRVLLPAAHNVIALIEPVEKPGDFRRVVLKVAVQGENQVAPGGLKRGREGSRLAEVATEPDCADARVTLRKRKQ